MAHVRVHGLGAEQDSVAHEQEAEQAHAQAEDGKRGGRVFEAQDGQSLGAGADALRLGQAATVKGQPSELVDAQRLRQRRNK